MSNKNYLIGYNRVEDMFKSDEYMNLVKDKLKLESTKGKSTFRGMQDAFADNSAEWWVEDMINTIQASRQPV